LYLSIELKDVKANIPVNLVGCLAKLLPELIKPTLPKNLQLLSALIETTGVKIEQKNGGTTIYVYFPLIPTAVQKPFQDMLGDLKPKLEAILPVFLTNALNQIEIRSGISTQGAADPPLSTCPTKNSVVGLQMRLDNAKQVFPQPFVDVFKALLPALLKDKLKDLNLPQAVQDELWKLIKNTNIDLKQKLVPEGLWLYITFPSLPSSSYIALYEPLFQKYVATKTVFDFINKQLKSSLFTSVCNGACTVTQFGLIDQNNVIKKPSLKPTKKPTSLKPTKKPTKPTLKPTKKPTGKPTTKKPTLTPTNKPTLKPTKKPTTLMPTTVPTTVPPTPKTAPPIVATAPPRTAPPTSKPTALSTSGVNTLTPAFVVLIAGVAAFV